MPDDLFDEPVQNSKFGGSGLKFILVAIILQFVTLGACYFYLVGDDDAINSELVVESSEVKQDSESVGNAGEEQSEVVLKGESEYVQIGPVVTNIVASENYEYIQVVLTLMTASPQLIQFVQKFDKKIKNIIQYQVRDLPSSDLMTNAGIELLTKNIEAQLNQFLKEHGLPVKYVEELFLSDVIIE